MHPDPIRQFRVWMDDAISSGIPEPNAMTLATATTDGKPSARVVLLKEVNENGFVFFTNYDSRKGRELTENPCAALVFDWHETERQVRVEGRVEKISAAESDAYFHSRPSDSRLGAWASPQSREIASREELDKLQQQTEDQFNGKEIPRPPHWGGFLVRPARIEFWQGRPNRLHDRIVYQLDQQGWEIIRLAP